MRLFSVLVNAGVDPNAEDGFGHNAQYYVDHSNEVVIPEWQAKWSNIALAQSPTPKQKSERSAIAKAEAAQKSARKKKRDGE